MIYGCDVNAEYLEGLAQELNDESLAVIVREYFNARDWFYCGNIEDSRTRLLAAQIELKDAYAEYHIYEANIDKQVSDGFLQIEMSGRVLALSSGMSIDGHVSDIHNYLPKSVRVGDLVENRDFRGGLIVYKVYR